MFRKTLPAVVLTLIVATFAFGQQSETPKEQIEKPCMETQTLADQIAQAQKRQVIELNEKSSLQTSLLKNLLPSRADAWVVKIETTGGFSGNGLPTLTITSNGDLFVASDNFSSGREIRPNEGKKLKTEVLQKISQIIFALTEQEKQEITTESSNLAVNKIPFLCNDCYQTSIIVGRRDPTGEVRFFTNRDKNVLFSNGDFKHIHQIIMENTRASN